MQYMVSVNIKLAEAQTIGVDKYLCLGYFDFGLIDYPFRVGDLQFGL